MGFLKKTWVDRISEYPARRRLKKSDGTEEVVTVSREEGTISKEGDAFSAQNMNDLETRVSDAFDEVNNSLGIWEEFKITPISATSSNYTKGFYNDALKLVKIEFEAYNTNGNGWTGQTTLGTIPEKYRPKGSRLIGGGIYIVNQQIYCPFEIKANGSIIQKISSGTYTQARCFGFYNI